jgi:hypothetical protein
MAKYLKLNPKEIVAGNIHKEEDDLMQEILKASEAGWL